MLGGGDPDGVGVVQTGRFLEDFDLEYRVNMIQAHFSEIGYSYSNEMFARCARRRILKQIWRNPGKGQVPKSGAEPPCCCWLLDLRVVLGRCVEQRKYCGATDPISVIM